MLCYVAHPGKMNEETPSNNNSVETKHRKISYTSSEVCSDPGVEEIVARCDWEDSPSRTHFDDMDEWALSDCDLPNEEILDTSSESLEPINGYQNGYQSEPFSDDDVELPGNCGYRNGYHVDTTNNGNHGNHGNHLRDTVAQTEEHCRRMYEEFKKLRKQLRDVSERVQYDRPMMLTTSQQLASSRDLLDNDSSGDEEGRHSVCTGDEDGRHSVCRSGDKKYQEGGGLVSSKGGDTAAATWGNPPSSNRLKRGKSSVRLCIENGASKGSMSLREIVREVCSEEAVSDLAVIRSQLDDKNEEIEQLQCENDDLISNITSLDSRVGELSDQIARLQSLNRSLQAQNFNLSTTLSQKDVTFDKLKKYLHKGPPSRTQTSSPLSSIPEASPNSAHKFGFVNRSTQSISRRKSLRPWKKRLAILDNNNLSVFKVETVESLIPIGSIIDIQVDKKRLFGKNVIVIRTDDNREHFFQTGSESDMLEWVDRLEALMSQ